MAYLLLATADDGVEKAARQQLEHAREAARLALNPAPVRRGPRGSQCTRPDIEQIAAAGTGKIRAAWRACRNADPASLPDLSVVPSQISRPGLLGLLPLLGGDPMLQNILLHLNFVRNSSQAQARTLTEAEAEGDNPAEMLFSRSGTLMSTVVQAELTGKSRKTVSSRRLPQVASSVLLRRALHAIQVQGFKGLLLGCVRKYDESPFTLRVLDSGELRQQAGKNSLSREGHAGCTAKVLSTKHRIFMLLRAPPDGSQSSRYMLLRGDAPSRLHVIEKQTAEHIKMCQEAVMEDVPIPMELAGKFGFRVSFPCTDRFSGMIKAERLLSEGWLKSHSLCAVHRAASAQGHMMELVSPLVTGVLSSALAMQKAGAASEVREAFWKILQERLVILHGPPLMQEYRSALYEVLLPATGEDELQHRRQRLVLDKYLNGNIMDQTRVIHMTQSTQIDRNAILEEFREAVLPALLPQACAPYFNRSKWLGGERAFSWHALLATHHGLHKLLICAWAGVKPAGAASVGTPAETPPAPPGWAEVARRLLAPAPAAKSAAAAPAAAVDEDEAGGALVALDAAAPSAGAAAEDDDPDAAKSAWVRWNKKHREKSVAFAQQEPESSLVAARVCTQPFVQLLRRLCKISGSAFEKRQLLACARGERRSFRVLELYYGNALPTFQREVNATFRAPVTAWRQGDRRMESVV